MDERNRLRFTFDAVAYLYDEVRPGYPPGVFEAIDRAVHARHPARVLEIGAGTGQFTIGIAPRGYSIVALEPGELLATILRRKVAPYPNVEVRTVTFEDWSLQEGGFDVVVAAQSFHWIDAHVGLRRAAQALRHGGTIGLIWSVDTSDGSAFYQATQPVYDRYFTSDGPGSVLGTLRHRIGQYRSALADCPDFRDVREFRYDWTQTWSGDDYLKLLNTYSDHHALPEPSRSSFFREVAAIIDAMGATVTRQFETLVLLAERR